VCVTWCIAVISASLCRLNTVNRDCTRWIQCHIAGYGGVHCELRYSASVIQCLSSSCHNGGLCLPSNASNNSNITCVCPTGYVGDDCSIKVWWNLHSVRVSIKRQVAVFENKLTYWHALIIKLRHRGPQTGRAAVMSPQSIHFYGSL